MNECMRTERISAGGELPDKDHLAACRDCRDAMSAHGLFRRLANADDLTPTLPDPKVLYLKAELMRRQIALQSEGDPARWAGVGIWTAIAITWLVVLTWKLGEIQGLLERFDFVASMTGGAMTAAILVAAIGGLMAFAVFAVAIHTVLAEM